jgi:hypothetical protein
VSGIGRNIHAAIVNADGVGDVVTKREESAACAARKCRKRLWKKSDAQWQYDGIVTTDEVAGSQSGENGTTIRFSKRAGVTERHSLIRAGLNQKVGDGCFSPQ